MSLKWLITATVLGLMAVEGLAWWWMNPPRTGTGEPMLVYRPGIRGQEETSARSPLPDQQSPIPNPQSSIPPSSTFSSPNLQSPISNLSSFTPLPEIYQQAAPMLRCSGGQIFRVNTPDQLTLHLAFFEWNDTDTGSVLEAFRHMPEACLGSLGMKLISKEKPIRYTVEGQRSEIRGQGSGGRGQQMPSSEPNSTSNIQNPTSPTCGMTLLFDHTIFLDPGSSAPGFQPRVHSFRAVWVSGMEQADARRGIDGRELDQLRTIRIKAAFSRYRPRHACVIQGAVRGALTAGDAWDAFEENMLRKLAFEP